MTTAFPTALDNYTNPAPTDDVSVVSHSAQHSNHNDAIEALEAKVGINSSAVTTSLDYKMSQRVVGPSSATDNAIARYDGTTGKIIQNSLVTIEDDGTVRLNSSGTKTFVTSGTELIFKQTGDTYQETYMSIRNRGGNNGPTFAQAGVVSVLDTGFELNASDGGYIGLRTYRLEGRSGFTLFGIAPESGWGVAGGPSFAYNDSQVALLRYVPKPIVISNWKLGDTSSNRYDLHVTSNQPHNTGSGSVGSAYMWRTSMQGTVRYDLDIANRTIQAFETSNGSPQALGSPVGTSSSYYPVQLATRPDVAAVVISDNDGGGYLQLFDIRLPHTIVAKGVLGGFSDPLPDGGGTVPKGNLLIDGDLVYWHQGNHNLRTIDISDWDNPVLVHTLDFDDGREARDISRNGKLLMCWNSLGWRMVSTANPRIPADIGGGDSFFQPVGGGPRHGDWDSGRYAVCASHDNDGSFYIEFVDTYDRTLPVTVNDEGNYTALPTQPEDIKLEGGGVYVALDNNDGTNLLNFYESGYGPFPTLGWSYSLAGAPRCIDVQGDYVHVSCSSGVLQQVFLGTKYAQSTNSGSHTSETLNVTKRAQVQRLDVEEDVRVRGAIVAENCKDLVLTPTLTNVANLQASTAYPWRWARIGRTVLFSGRVDVDPTVTLTDTQLGISIPPLFASDFANVYDVAGSAYSPAIAAQGAALLADTSNNRITMQWKAADVSNQAMYCAGSYQIN